MPPKPILPIKPCVLANWTRVDKDLKISGSRVVTTREHIRTTSRSGNSSSCGHNELQKRNVLVTIASNMSERKGISVLQRTLAQPVLATCTRNQDQNDNGPGNVGKEKHC